jgi:RHS repeat-associated protein
LNTSSTIVKTFAYTYDAVGHLLTSTDPDSKYTYTYDAVDRFTSVDNTGTAGVPGVKFNYSYDAVGNLLTVNDSINGVNAGITAYTYDLLNRATRLTQSGTGVGNKRVDMAYNAVNRLTNLSRFSDLTGTNPVAETNYVYDSNQRLIQLSHKKGGSTIANYDYSYDATNKLTQTVSSVDGTSDYSYDATNQLTGTDNSSLVDEAYSYDANGNRTNSGYGTGVDNRLLTDGIYNYAYDDEGNRTRRVEIATGKVTEYNWDYRNRLAGVVFKDAGGVVTKTIQYTYDVDDRRIGKKIDGVTTERFVYDGSNIALVFDGAGVQTHRYLYGTGVDTVLADERGGSVVWALADNLGTIRDVLDGNGTILNHVSYDSFGKVVSQSDAGVEFRYGFTGREQDNETGLDYYRARYYDSAVGRFISEDPIGFRAGDTNLTRYVGNNPVNWVDPSGLAPVRPLNEGAGIDWRGISVPSGTPGSGYRGSGNGFGVNTLRGGGSAGSSGNFRPTSPYTPSVDPRSRYQPSDRGTPNYGVPSNSTSTPIPGNNPNVPDASKCPKFNEEYANKEQEKFWNIVRTKGIQTKNKKCKYVYINPTNPNSRSNVYARFASGSPYEFALADTTSPLGERQLYDGITPGTNRLWEAKSTLDNQVGDVRFLYNTGKTNFDSLNKTGQRRYNKIIDDTQQARRSLNLALKCGFTFKYAVNSKEYQRFLNFENEEFPRQIKVLHIPRPGLELIS